MSQDRMARIDRFLLFYSSRTDKWRSLAGTAQEWAEGLSDPDAVREALAEISTIEEFHAFPGPQIMRFLVERIEASDAGGTAALARQISEAILTDHEVEGTLDETGAKLEQDAVNFLPSVLSGTEHQRPYFEALFVSEQPRDRWVALREQLRQLRRPEDQFTYRPVFVASFEDAICAALINPRIASIVTIDDIPYRSRYEAPVLRQLLDPIVPRRRSQRASGTDLARVLKGIAAQSKHSKGCQDKPIVVCRRSRFTVRLEKESRDSNFPPDALDNRPWTSGSAASRSYPSSPLLLSPHSPRGSGIEAPESFGRIVPVGLLGRRR
jgi:arginine decarboxylase